MISDEDLAELKRMSEATGTDLEDYKRAYEAVLAATEDAKKTMAALRRLSGCGDDA